MEMQKYVNNEVTQNRTPAFLLESLIVLLIFENLFLLFLYLIILFILLFYSLQKYNKNTVPKTYYHTSFREEKEASLVFVPPLKFVYLPRFYLGV